MSHPSPRMHAFRDGATFLRLIDTSNIWALNTLFPCITWWGGGGSSSVLALFLFWAVVVVVMMVVMVLVFEVVDGGC